MIRADGGPSIGIGHVMRCLALAQSWIAAGGRVRLACTALPPAIAERYHDEGAEVMLHESWPPEDLIDDAAAVVADGLGIADSDLAAVADAGVPLVTVDDMGHRAAYPGALVVNQNLHADPALYAGKTAARLCLGPQWALLRREFRNDAHDRFVETDAGIRLLILMGGADPKEYTRLALNAAARAAERLAVQRPAADPEIVVVAGAANPAVTALQEHAADLHLRIDVRHDVRDMAGLLRGVDLAVSAAGSTLLEMAALGVPMIVGAQNETETGPAAALADRGGGIDIGPWDSVDGSTLADTIADLIGDDHRRRALGLRARELVDGRGADRVARTIAQVVAHAVAERSGGHHSARE